MAKIGAQYSLHAGAMPVKMTSCEESETKTLVDEDSQCALISKSTQPGPDKCNCSEPNAENNKIVYEAWKISRYVRGPQVFRKYTIMGVLPWVVEARYKSPVITAAPENIYCQAELEAMFTDAREGYLRSPSPKSMRKTPVPTYEDHLDNRVRQLEDDVQRRLVWWKTEASV